MTDEWIKKLWYMYTMECYSAVKKNTFESVLMRWRDLKPVTHSEMGQREKDSTIYQCIYMESRKMVLMNLFAGQQ